MRIIFLIVVFLLCACNNNKNCSYKEAIQRGEIKDYKTSFIRINDSLNFKLDYVRHQLYKEKEPFCYGNMELNKERFSVLCNAVAPHYNSANVRILDLLCANKDLCEGEALEFQNIKGYLIYYINDEKRLSLDYVNLITSEKETYPVSDAYATVKRHFLFERSGIELKPSIVELKNMGFNFQPDDILMIKKSEDKLYKKINGK